MIYSVRTFLSQSRRISIDREGREGGRGEKAEKEREKKAADFTDELPRATTAAFPLSKGV